jgi:hypothetical protein
VPAGGADPEEYDEAMCAGCAMAAAAGATGVRSWLQAHHLTWLTPARMHRVTIALMVVALAVSTIGFSGSTKPAHPHRPAAHAAR